MPNDSAMIQFVGGPFAAKRLGIRIWPPPEVITMVDLAGVAPAGETPDEGAYERTSYSRLTDEECESPHLMRAAEYTWRPA